MCESDKESKELALELKTNEDKYITGEFDLLSTLDKTDELYQQTLEAIGKNPSMTHKVLNDANLMKVQSRLAKQCAVYYKPDSLVFNPEKFSEKLLAHYTQHPCSSSQKSNELLWTKLGEEAKKLMCLVPSFNFIYGTFDFDQVEIVKKQRKQREREKVGAVTKPDSVNLNEAQGNEDPFINEAKIILSVLNKLCQKSENNLLCYFEFVTDPTSYVRTVENMFIVSLLVKEGCVRIIEDQNGLPCLTKGPKDKKPSHMSVSNQCIVSISKEEWKDIIETFGLKKPLIPPRKSILM